MSRRRCQCWWGTTFACFLIGIAGAVESTLASPPTLTHLFPAGGQRGATVTVTCHGEFAWPVSIWASGADIHPATEKGQFEISLPHQLETDRIWIRLYNKDGASQTLPFRIGSLPEVTEVEPNDAPATSQRMAEVTAPAADTHITVNGVLKKNGDVDGFAVNLSSGQTLVAALQANRELGSPMDAILQIVSPDGVVIAENHDDVGLDPRLALTAPKSGKYIVRLFAFPAQPDQRIQFRGGENYIYRLTLTTGPYMTHALPLSVGMDESRTVAVQGWNVPPGTRLPVTSLRVPWMAGDLEFERDDSLCGPPTRIGFVRAPAWAGSARLRLVPYHVAGNLAGDEPPVRLPCPTAVSGCLDTAGRTDQYLLPLHKDQQIVLRVEARNLDSHLVPRVSLVDPQGKVVGEVRESGPERDATLTYRAALGGDHRLSIGDRYHHGGSRYFYRLTLGADTTDFAMSLDTDSVQLTPDQPVSLPVTIRRRNAAGAELGRIRVHAEGLPPGVRANDVYSEASGDSASKVSLQLETTGTTFSGRIRICGTSTEPPLHRCALTPQRFNASFDHIWLTVKPIEIKDP